MMTMETILSMTDHAAEASDTLEEIGYPESNEGCIAHAQVHATLAVAEELRTANLIAYIGQAQAALEGDATGIAVTWLAEETRKIRERLGMKA